MSLAQILGVLLLAAGGNSTLQGQVTGCPGELADQVVKISYPLKPPVDSLRPRVDSVLQALGYSAAKPHRDWEYQSLPRYGWPTGTENAPWRKGDVPPGAIVALKFTGKKRGEVQVWVQVQALCAERSRKASTDENGIEYIASLATAMQVAFAFETGVDSVLHVYDKKQ
jgi:hypothetical protein